MKEIVIGCDNSAVGLKEEVKKLLSSMDIIYEDVGVNDETDQELYPNIAVKVANKIIESGYKKEGILICGTGIGMAISANKFKRIYASVCHDIYSTQRAKLSNNANIMTLGARVIGTELAKTLVKEWVSLEFKPGRSTPKVERIVSIEDENLK
ncbi:MAG: RpiB/LacA/LacB family sugar-phosphate isomerase [Ruminiclostridium sp.]